MTTLDYMALFFGSLFVGKVIWVIYEKLSGKSDDDDPDGPVSGWGTPQG